MKVWAQNAMMSRVLLSPEQESSLIELLTILYASRSNNMKTIGVPQDIPSELQPYLLQEEPYGTRLQSDLPMYLSMPQQALFGREITLLENEITTFEHWDISIAGVSFAVHWSLHMDGREPDFSHESLGRVIWDGQSWKIVSIWDEHIRESCLEQFAQMQSVMQNASEMPEQSGIQISGDMSDGCALSIVAIWVLVVLASVAAFFVYSLYFS